MTPDLVEYDPAHHHTFLVHDLTDPQKKLYVTRNFGETFSHVQDYVKSFYLRPSKNNSNQEDSELFVQRLNPPGNRTTILSSRNFFERQVDTIVLYNGAEEFELRGDYMFVAKRREDGSMNGTARFDLYISIHGERFVPAKFGPGDGDDNANLDYHIIDVTEDGQVNVQQAPYVPYVMWSFENTHLNTYRRSSFLFYLRHHAATFSKAAEQEALPVLSSCK